MYFGESLPCQTVCVCVRKTVATCQPTVDCLTVLTSCVVRDETNELLAIWPRGTFMPKASVARPQHMLCTFIERDGCGGIRAMWEPNAFHNGAVHHSVPSGQEGVGSCRWAGNLRRSTRRILVEPHDELDGDLDRERLLDRAGAIVSAC